MIGEAQGSEDSIKSFLKELNHGPRAAHVVKVEKEEINTKVCTFQSDFFLLDTKPEVLDIFLKGMALFHALIFSRAQVLGYKNLY